MKFAGFRMFVLIVAVLVVTSTAQLALAGDPIIGLCCLPDGQCRDVFRGEALTEAECLAQGGTYAGDNTSCGGAECEYCCWDTTICNFWVPPPKGNRSRACCTNNGDCSGPMSQCNCLGPGGEQGLWMLDNSECAPGICPLTGGCELPSGNCIIRSGMWCCRNRGFFRGEGSTCAPPCPADIDGDRLVGVPDLLALLAGWGTPDPDLDGDGIVAVPDLLVLLAAWGACP